MAQGAVPVFARNGPDAGAYGELSDYPIGFPLNKQQNMIGDYSNEERLFPTHTAAAARQPSLLQRASQELAITYTFQGKALTLQDYLHHNPTTGLLIARDDTILFEHYQYARNDHHRFNSQSMAKTVTAMLIGIAVQEGAIHSIDDAAQAYVPKLTGTELGRTPIRALLHMTSGIEFRQDYSGANDDARLNEYLFARSGPDTATIVSRFNTRVAAPEVLWSYANLNTEVLGLILTHATHMPLGEYLKTRIWQPMGAESDARWTIDHSGQEIAYCCFNATLRDYARFGLLLAHDGERDGHQVIPRQWLLDATQPVTEGSYLAVDKSPHPWGYGYQVWLMPAPRRTFVLEGIHGQRIFVDPETHLVLVHTAVRLKPTHDIGEAELIALWRAVLEDIETP